MLTDGKNPHSLRIFRFVAKRERKNVLCQNVFRPLPYTHATAFRKYNGVSIIVGQRLASAARCSR